MYGGDISNQSEPRILFVFDELVASIFPEHEKLYKLELKFHRYKSATKRWEFNPTAASRLRDLWWRKGYRFDIVSFQPEEIEEHLQKRVDQLQIPYSSFWTTTPEKLARDIAMMPDVLLVYDANPTHRLTYGGKGRTVIDPREI